MQTNVAWVLWEKNRCGFDADVTHISESWQRLVLNHNEFGGIGGDGWAFGNDGHHFLADVTHKVMCEWRLSKVFGEQSNFPDGDDG
ncbi:unannotated protein [freshwater metagenome]|uniref:Unannotated protein n=1 Tax=freshwater metagenome TaxID=449393 RepID=A0A6J6Y4H5_9ZZZZ